jgi:multiple sugar transport system substrate-binding protein
MDISLDFSLIGPPSQNLRELLDEFQDRHNIKINLLSMTWENAWPNLLTHALYGKGADVSHIGSTWGSSLVAMNALREFKPQEIEALGGPQAFIPSAWESAGMVGMDGIWSLPWSAFTFLILYRRDILQSNGVEPATAFETPAEFKQTVEKLKQACVASPLLLPSGAPFLDRIHIAASWMWKAGGYYISPDGKQAGLNLPRTYTGLLSFFELYRLLSPEDTNLDYDTCLQHFQQGKAAIVIADCSYPYTLAHGTAAPNVVENLGVHSLPGIPVVSGDNLIIWRSVQQESTREKAAIALVQFLVGREAQERFCQTGEQFPVRLDAMDAIRCCSPEVNEALRTAFLQGQAHKPFRLWSRIEFQLGRAFDDITADILNQPEIPVDTILNTHLLQLQEHLELILA